MIGERRGGWDVEHREEEEQRMAAGARAGGANFGSTSSEGNSESEENG